MSCEDCKNYEPKQAEDDKQRIKEFRNALHEACCHMVCGDCSFGPIIGRCPVAKEWVGKT